MVYTKIFQYFMGQYRKEGLMPGFHPITRHPFLIAQPVLYTLTNLQKMERFSERMFICLTVRCLNRQVIIYSQIVCLATAN